MGVTESRYNAITNLGDKKDALIVKKKTLQVELARATTELALRVKNVNLDKENIKAKATTEQKSMVEENAKSKKLADQQADKRHTMEMAKFERLAKELEEAKAIAIERLSEEKQQNKDNYDYRKSEADGWVANADKRCELVDRQTEAETLRVKGLSDALKLEIEAIDQQMLNLEQTMKVLSEVSMQAPPSTKG